MFIEKKVNYTEKRKVAAAMKMDGYMSMTEISGRGMYFEYKNGLYKVLCTPNELKECATTDPRIPGYKLHFGGNTYKYWYDLEALSKTAYVKLERSI